MRSFSNEGENKSRAGVPTSLAMHDMGLACNQPQNKMQLETLTA